ncbi:hypothetical protein OKW28_003894 [Paraburkholderia sp. 40]
MVRRYASIIGLYSNPGLITSGRIFAIGASHGGIDALQRLVDADFVAAARRASGFEVGAEGSAATRPSAPVNCVASRLPAPMCDSAGHSMWRSLAVEYLKERSIRVRDVMSAPAVTVDESTPLGAGSVGRRHRYAQRTAGGSSRRSSSSARSIRCRWVRTVSLPSSARQPPRKHAPVSVSPTRAVKTSPFRRNA